MNGRFYVYVLYRPWNGEPCYVGKGQGKRYRSHFTDPSPRNLHLANTIKKAGGSLPHQIVFETDDENEAFAEEIRLIREIGRTNLQTGPLCNLTDGGEGFSGLVRTKEHSLRNSAAKKGNKCHLGHTHSPETKAILAEKSRLLKNFKGKKHTEASIERMRNSHKRENLSASTLAKMSAAKIGNQNAAGPRKKRA